MTEECPNCITPWKCNGPHLERCSNGWYKFNNGFFIKENKEWTFLPNEKEIYYTELLHIAETLRYLNRLESLQRLTELDEELGLL